MNEEKLQELLQEASRSWRIPPEPRVADMWETIEAAHFDRPRQSLTPRWWVLISAIAAALVFGVALGRYSVVDRAARREVAAHAGVAEPYGRQTTELLGQTAVLLAALPREVSVGGAQTHFAAQAEQLLVTTRLLLDSPVATDQRLRVLLEDLELVLAQVAQLPAASRRNAAELEIITEALEERDVVPRIRTAVASLSGDN